MSIEQKSLANKYLLYKFLTNLWFFSAVWIYFYRLVITDQQIGIMDGISFAVGLIAEVPSGALADRFGRDKIVKFGQFFVGLGLLIEVVGNNFYPFLIGQAILMIGAAFMSGADQALFFEKLKFKENSLYWRKLVTRSGQAVLAALLLATLIGGYLHTIDIRITWYLTIGAFFSSILVIQGIKDTRNLHKKEQVLEEFKHYGAQIRDGFKQFVLPQLRMYLPIIFIIQALYYTAGWGILRLILITRFEIGPFLGAIVVTICSLVTIGILSLLHKYTHKIPEKILFITIALSAAGSLLFSVGNIGLWGGLVIFALYAGEHVLYPYLSEILNNHAKENHRATVLSVASFIKVLPYIALAPIIGYLNTQNHLEYFLITWAILICIALGVYLVLSRKQRV